MNRSRCHLGRPREPYIRGNFEGEGHPIVKGHSAVTCVKTAQPIEMLFRLWARTGQGIMNYESDGDQIPHEKGQFWGKESPIVKYRDSLP